MKYLFTLFHGLVGIMATLGVATSETTRANAGTGATETIRRKLLAPKVNGTVPFIPRQYIVVFHSALVQNVTAKVEEILSSLPAPMTNQSSSTQDDMKTTNNVIHTYDAVIKGVSLRNVTDELLDRLDLDPHVRYYQQDKTGNFSSYKTQTVALGDSNWGLDRIDQESLPLDGRYQYKSTGHNVTVFVVDTGMRFSHVEFQGRARCGFDAIKSKNTQPCEDEAGHGTQVGSVVGGNTVGVAKDVNLVAVKVSDIGRVANANILAGLNYIKKQKNLQPSVPMVVVMSINPGPDQVIEDAAADLIDAGVSMIVSAGNDNADACYDSPRTHPNVITVGATDIKDAVASFSSFGSCVTLYAPGVAIKTAARRADAAYTTKDGTSFSAPHVAGVVARLLESKPDMTPRAIQAVLIRESQKMVLTGVEGPTSTNRLLHLKGTTNIPECRYTGKWSRFCP